MVVITTQIVVWLWTRYLCVQVCMLLQRIIVTVSQKFLIRSRFVSLLSSLDYEVRSDGMFEDESALQRKLRLEATKIRVQLGLLWPFQLRTANTFHISMLSKSSSIKRLHMRYTEEFFARRVLSSSDYTGVRFGNRRFRIHCCGGACPSFSR